MWCLKPNVVLYKTSRRKTMLKKGKTDHPGPPLDTPVPPLQCPTGTRYPTRTRSFFQYPIRTRFVFKIIGYFGYRVFQKTMFLTWKTASRRVKILTNILFIWLSWTGHYFNILWANFNWLSSIIMSPLCFHGFSIYATAPNCGMNINDGGVKERCKQWN